MSQFTRTQVGKIRLNDTFFAPRIQTNHDATLPANLAKCHETGRIDALKLQWKEGMPNHPHIFWDSDVAKVLEGMAYDLILNPDPEQEKALNEYVELMCSVQQEDGYLNSYFMQCEKELRWKNLKYAHELYCAGHMMEAAVAHYQATGKKNFMDAMSRYTDLIISLFGKEEGKRPGYPGHEEIELALCKMADATGDPKYLALSRYFVDERGQEPNFFERESRERGSKDDPFNVSYCQAHKPVREQSEAVGHAVRALYLYSGMADVADRTGDKELLNACKRLFDDVVNTKMFITGCVGSRPGQEAIGDAYELPNETAYAESCAAIALVLFAERLLNITGDAKYADIMERVLYNGAISGIALNGVDFFYGNPQVVKENRTISHQFMTAVRSPWFDCSCCPTNYCRFIPQIATFAYSASADTLRINIPAAAKGCVTLNGGELAFELEGGYPFDGKITFRVLSAPENECRIAFRIPGWCRKYTAPEGSVENGYLVLKKVWKAGDTVALNLDMPVIPLYSHAAIEENAGKFVLSRGPVIYCLEGIDNDGNLSRFIIPADQEFALEKTNLPDTAGITGKAFREVKSDALFTAEKPELQETVFHAVPYALWQNRGKTTMALWMRYC